MSYSADELADYRAEVLALMNDHDTPANYRPDDRCCGDHPGAWETMAVPGTGWCPACLARLVGGT